MAQVPLDFDGAYTMDLFLRTDEHTLNHIFLMYKNNKLVCHKYKSSYKLYMYFDTLFCV